MYSEGEDPPKGGHHHEPPALQVVCWILKHSHSPIAHIRVSPLYFADRLAVCSLN